jgi:catalase
MATSKPRTKPAPPADHRGEGDELHQRAGGGHPALTTNQGMPVEDNQNSLRDTPRGPTLLEDFILREKITHFDHERIPERIVHARGSAAHGYFELTRSLHEYTRARVLTEVGVRTPVFTRFSTVAGGAGSVDTPRDVRGFAVKFYTREGNWDLVGNNIPVFFIQDAIKFPDLIHAVKMEPDRAFPQAASAHDTFWDFVSLMPESMHMIMWAMSDRTIPRSLRTIEGFGIHSFRLLNDAGESTFVKFHWRPKLGLQSTVWDEAVKLQSADNDFHRRDLFEAITAGDFPEWELAVQLFTEEEAEAFPFDHLDSTKIIPESLVPLTVIGRMVLDRWPDNFFAETEQVAYCPANVPPGIDFSNDPLLQGRLFSYLDTQLSGWAGPISTRSRSMRRNAPSPTTSATGTCRWPFPRAAWPTTPARCRVTARAKPATVSPAMPPRPTMGARAACVRPASPTTTARHACSSAAWRRRSRRMWPRRWCSSCRRWRPPPCASAP